MTPHERSLRSWILTGRWDPAERPPPPRVVAPEGSALRLTVGPALLLLVTPFLAQVVWVVVYHHAGSAADFVTTFTAERFLAELPRPTLAAAGWVAAWVALQAALLWLLPGGRFEGPVTPAGNVPVYRRNGVAAWAVTHALLLLGVRAGVVSPAAFWRGYGSMLSALNLGALGFCAFLYWKGCRWPSSTDARRTGRLAFDFFQGVELHPTLFGADLKQLINCRVSMMGWSATALLLALARWELTGRFSWAMLATAGLTMVYLFKFFVWEGGYLHSLDIMHDRFGYYICWGVLCWVPAVYCLPALYVAQREGDLHPLAALALVALGLGAVAVNYAADAQRQYARRERERAVVWGRKAELIYARYRTADGAEREGVLLASGWWGIARHFHYVPELLAALCWSLPAGGRHALPYFYVAFLAVLLVDRARRDDARCRAKYGEHWEDYCRRVPWKILPGVY